MNMESEEENQMNQKMEIEENEYQLIDPQKFDRNQFYWGLCHKGKLSFDEAIDQFQKEQNYEDDWISEQISQKTSKLKKIRLQYELLQENNQIELSQDLENIDNSINNINNDLIQTKKWKLDSINPYALKDIESLNQLIQNKTNLRIQRQLLQFKDTGEENNYIQYYLKLNQLEKKYSQQQKVYQKLQVLYKVNKQSAATFNNDGSILVTVNSDQINFWELKNDQLKLIQQLQTQGRYQIGVVFSKNQNIIIIYDLNGSFGIIVKENDCWKLQCTISAHTEIIRFIKFISDDQEIISAGSEGQVKIWQKDSNNQWNYFQQFLTRGKGLNSFDMYDESYITSGDIYGNLIFWKFKNNRCSDNSSFNQYKLIKYQRIVQAHKSVINSITYINQKQLASMCYEQEIKIWKQGEDNKLFDQIQKIDLCQSYPISIFVQVIRFIPNIQILVCNIGNQIIIYQNNQENHKFHEIQKIVKSSEQQACCLSNDGQYLVYSDPNQQKFTIRKYI